MGSRRYHWLNCFDGFYWSTCLIDLIVLLGSNDLVDLTVHLNLLGAHGGPLKCFCTTNHDNESKKGARALRTPFGVRFHYYQFFSIVADSGSDF